MKKFGMRPEHYLSPLYARSASLLRTTLDKELNNSTIPPFEEGVRGGKVIFPKKHMDFPLW